MRGWTAAGAALVIAPLAVLGSGTPAHADGPTARGACGTGTYELEAERDDGRIEVSADLDRLAPGSRWTVVIKHDGKRVVRVTRTADREGDVEVDLDRPDARGADVFRLKATSANGTRCVATVTVR
jgi:hypothetical protein